MFLVHKIVHPTQKKTNIKATTIQKKAYIKATTIQKKAYVKV